MSSTTEIKLNSWLADPANYCCEPWDWPLGGKHRGFSQSVIRNSLRCADGTTVSLQQSAGHYCNAEEPGREASFELWYCPHHPILEPYGTGEDPYGYVPMSVVVAYIDAHGGIAE